MRPFSRNFFKKSVAAVLSSCLLFSASNMTFAQDYENLEKTAQQVYSETMAQKNNAGQARNAQSRTADLYFRIDDYETTFTGNKIQASDIEPGEFGWSEGAVDCYISIINRNNASDIYWLYIDEYGYGMTDSNGHCNLPSKPGTYDMTVVIQQEYASMLNEESKLEATLTINPGSTTTSVNAVSPASSTSINTETQSFKSVTEATSSYDSSKVNFAGTVDVYTACLPSGQTPATSDYTLTNTVIAATPGNVEFDLNVQGTAGYKYYVKTVFTYFDNSGSSAVLGLFDSSEGVCSYTLAKGSATPDDSDKDDSTENTSESTTENTSNTNTESSSEPDSQPSSEPTTMKPIVIPPSNSSTTEAPTDSNEDDESNTETTTNNDTGSDSEATTNAGGNNNNVETSTNNESSSETTTDIDTDNSSDTATESPTNNTDFGSDTTTEPSTDNTDFGSDTTTEPLTNNTGGDLDINNDTTSETTTNKTDTNGNNSEITTNSENPSEITTNDNNDNNNNSDKDNKDDGINIGTVVAPSGSGSSSGSSSSSSSGSSGLGNHSSSATKTAFSICSAGQGGELGIGTNKSTYRVGNSYYYVPQVIAYDNYKFDYWLFNGKEKLDSIEGMTFKSSDVLVAKFTKSEETTSKQNNGLDNIDTISFTDLMSQYFDGSFYNVGGITRSEAISAIALILTNNNIPTSKGTVFSDVSSSEWYNDSVSYLSGRDIINGYADGTFRPSILITKGELCAVACSLFRYNTSDSNDDSHWAQKFAKEVSKNNTFAVNPNDIDSLNESVDKDTFMDFIRYTYKVNNDSNNNIQEVLPEVIEQETESTSDSTDITDATDKEAVSEIETDDAADSEILTRIEESSENNKDFDFGNELVNQDDNLSLLINNILSERR